MAAPALGGMLQEILPLPAVAQGAAALGQVDVALDGDGVARGAYLMAGLGNPYWPSLALALLRLDQPAGTTPLPGLRHNPLAARSPYLWERDHLVLLRYAGPAGSFGRVSYADVLDGKVPAALLRNKLVLIGATAEGLGDIVRTPDGPMPGVEYQANMLASVRRGNTILPLNLAARFLLGSFMLMLPLLLYGLPGLRRMWRAALAAALATLLLSVLLLRLAHAWWPPAACLELILGGTALGWLLARLETFARRRSYRKRLLVHAG